MKSCEFPSPLKRFSCCQLALNLIYLLNVDDVCLCVPLFVAPWPAVCLFFSFFLFCLLLSSTVLSACLLNKSAPLIAGQSVTVSGKEKSAFLPRKILP